MSEKVTIDHMSVSGEGVAKTPTGALLVPFTLPDEVVTIARDGAYGTMMGLMTQSQQRIAPACQHFEECGGCLLQHWQASSYETWKRSLVEDALQGRGIGTKVDGLMTALPQSRRRITLTARIDPKGQRVGFNKLRSHDVLEITECPVAAPELIAQLPIYRALAAVLANNAKAFHMTITATENGLDIALSGVAINDEKQRQKLIRLALESAILRLTLDGEIIVEKQKPFIHFGPIKIEIPSGGFLQATKDAENRMAELVLDGLEKTKNAADLFCGAGSFSFPMAQKMNVHAVEQDEAALLAFDRALRNSEGLKSVTYEKRDLFRRPLSVKELAAYDGVVFDPPRAGAEAQTRELAKSTVSRIVAISCNPVTLARDLMILLEGGYKLERVVPLDQFLWSPHVEVVATLSKKKPKPGWKL